MINDLVNSIKVLATSFRITELRKKIFITLSLLVVYRLGCHVPTPGIDTQALGEMFKRLSETAGGGILGVMGLFTGGALGRLAIFALGVMPYISSSIIMQLLTTIIPAFEKLAKEGKTGYQKINQFTRYGTVVLSVIQSYIMALWLEHPGEFGQGVQIVTSPGWSFRFLTVVTLTAGTIFLMWLGEQIQERGIGNGISLIITAGIISRIPAALHQLIILFSPFSPAKRQIPIFNIVLLALLLIIVCMGVIALTQGQRKIPVQYARRVVGRKIYGGQSTYLPLKVDQAGVIAIIFAQSIVTFPAMIMSFIPHAKAKALADVLSRGNVVYTLIYAALIIFFCYFYTAITFNPQDLSENMKKFGGFIPGIRPGTPTAEFLDYVLTRITLFGAVCIAIIAIFPDFIMAWLRVPYLIASFAGGTGILITVGVMLDTLRQIESHLVMHHQTGFLRTGRIKGRR